MLLERVLLSFLLALHCSDLSRAQEVNRCRLFLSHSSIRELMVPSNAEELRPYTAQLLREVLKEYANVLDVYYGTKRKFGSTDFLNDFSEEYLLDSAGPEMVEFLKQGFTFGPRTLGHISEFSRREYERYRSHIDGDPSLMGNLFLALFNDHGGGGANDVFQRFGAFVKEMIGGEPSFFNTQIAYDVSAIAIYQGRIAFNTVSRNWGFPRNFSEVSSEAESRTRQKFFGSLEVSFF